MPNGIRENPKGKHFYNGPKFMTTAIVLSQGICDNPGSEMSCSYSTVHLMKPLHTGSCIGRLGQHW